MSDGMSIGRFASACGLSASALRFYDDRGLLKPASVDATTGYREYTSDQLPRARLIRDLRKLGLALVDVAGYVDGDDDYRRSLVARHLEGVRHRLREAEEMARVLEMKSREKGEEMSTTVVAEELGRAVSDVVVAVGQEEVGPLKDVLVEASEGSLRLVATDRYRLVVRELSTRGGDELDFTRLVAADDLSSVREELLAGSTAVVEPKASDLAVVIDDQLRVIPAVGGDFPEYRGLLEPKRSGHALQLDRGRLVEAVEAAEAEEDAIKVAMAPGALVIHGRDERLTIEAAYDGTGLEFFVNKRFMLEALSPSVGPEVVIEATWPHAPVMFRSADEGSFICMIMPLQLA